MNKKPKQLLLAKVQSARWYAARAATILNDIVIAEDVGAQLSVAVKALRAIASSSDSSPRSKGLARTALKRIGLE